MQAATAAANALPSYLPSDERAIAALIVSHLIANGYTLSVFDGEAWAVKRSDDARELGAALGTTDADVIRVRRDGEVVGSVTLIWGNGNALLSDWASKASLEGAFFNATMLTLADDIEARFM